MGYKNPAHTKEPTEEEKSEALTKLDQKTSAHLEEVKKELEELSKFEIDLEKKAEEWSSLVDKVAEEEKKLNLTKEQSVEAKNLQDGLVKSCGVLEQKIIKLKKQIYSLEKEIEVLSCSLQKLEEVKKEIVELEAEKKKICGEYSKVFEQSKELKKDNEAFKEDITELAKEKTTLETDISKSKEEFAKLDKNKEQWINEIAKLEDKYKVKESEAIEKLNVKLTGIKSDAEKEQKKTEEALEEREGDVCFRENNLEEKKDVVRKQIADFEKVKGKRVNIII